MKEIELALVPEGPLAFDGVNYLYSDGEGFYIDSLARKFKQIIIFAYAYRQESDWYAAAATYKFKSKNIIVIELPFYENAGIFLKIYQLLLGFMTIWRNRARFKYMYIFYPGYPSISSYIVAKLSKKRFFSYSASDWSEAESDLIFKWKSKFLIPVKKVVSKVSLYFEKLIVTDSIFTLTASEDCVERYSKFSNRVHRTVPRMDFSKLTFSTRFDSCNGNSIKLLFVGGLYERKGIFVLARSFKELLKTGSYTLTIVGAGSDMSALSQILRREIENKLVFIVGHVDYGPNLMDFYRSADLFVFPSFGEGFPRVLYESMANSLPIVSSDVGGIARSVPHEQRGLLFDSARPELLTASVLRVVNDGSLRRKIIRNQITFMSDFLIRSDGGAQVHELLEANSVRNGDHEL